MKTKLTNLVLAILAATLSLASAQRIRDLPAIDGDNVDPAADVMEITDLSALSSKKITVSELFTAPGLPFLKNDGTAASLRTARVNGYNSLASIPTETWRIAARLQREQSPGGGVVFANRFRSLTLGDSVAVDLQSQVSGFFGFGGADSNLQAWTKQAASTPSDGAGEAGYTTWSAGVYTFFDKWDRTIGGHIAHIDSSITNGTYVEQTAISYPYHSVFVQFLSGNNTGGGDLSYGKFKLQHQVNKTGSWVDTPVTFVTSNANTGVNFKLNGAHTSGNTTIAVNTGTGTLEVGAKVWINLSEYTITTGTTGPGNIIITPGLVSNLNSGTDVYNTIVNSNSGAAEAYAQAIFTLPKFDKYNIRIVATSGRARLCEAFFNAGGFTQGASTISSQSAINGGLSVSYAQGGKSLDAHFSQYSQSVLNAGFGMVDPHVVIYKSANNYALNLYQTHWTTFATKVRTAAPNALFIVCGSHPSSGSPTNLDAGYLATDDFLRDWCASTPGAIFVDVRQSFPPYSTDNGADDLWSDGIHIYSEASDDWGGGDQWIANLVWETIRPACEPTTRTRGGIHVGTVLPMVPNEIRLYDAGAVTARSGKLAFTTAPRIGGQIMLRPAEAYFNGGTQLFDWEAGFSQNPSDDPDSRYTLNLHSTAGMVMRFGSHASINAGYFGAIIGQTPTAARSKDGLRVLAPTQSFGPKPALVAEGLTSQASTSRIFGIDREASASAVGLPLWSWFPNGNIEYEGATDNAFEATFVTGDPTADVTITTPTINSGTVNVFLTGTGSLDFPDLAPTTEATLTITVTGAVTTNTPTVELGWSAALTDGLAVKQAWVSAANTVSVRIMNYRLAGNVDASAVTCRATVTNH